MTDPYRNLENWDFTDTTKPNKCRNYQPKANDTQMRNQCHSNYPRLGWPHKKTMKPDVPRAAQTINSEQSE